MVRNGHGEMHEITSARLPDLLSNEALLGPQAIARRQENRAEFLDQSHPGRDLSVGCHRLGEAHADARRLGMIWTVRGCHVLERVLQQIKSCGSMIFDKFSLPQCGFGQTELREVRRLA